MRFIRVIILFLSSVLIVLPVHAEPLPTTSTTLTKQIEQLEANNPNGSQNELLAAHKATLRWINEYEKTIAKTAQYEIAINNFAVLSAELKKESAKVSQNLEPNISANQSSAQLEQQISLASSQLLDLSRQLQQEQDNFRDIIDSVSHIPQKQTTARRLLDEAEQRLTNISNNTTALAIAQQNQLKAEIEARNAVINKLSLEQLSANNRQELSRLKIELLKKQYEQTDRLVQQLRDELNNQRQSEAQQSLETTQNINDQNDNLPESIRAIIETNTVLSQDLNLQANKLSDLSLRQRTTVSNTLQVRQALNTLKEQAEWLNISTALGETLRLQLAKLPGKQKPLQLEKDMADIRLQRLNYQSELSQLEKFSTSNLMDDQYQSLTKQQVALVNQLVTKQKELLNSLLSGCDSLILEITHLRVSINQLNDALDEIQEATHRYFFWVADVNPVSLNFPFDVINSLAQLFSLDTFSQLTGAFWMILTTPKTLTLMLLSIAFVFFGFSLKKSYHTFLERAAARVGKVTKDDFKITLRTTFWSIVIAVPIPLLWATLGYSLQNAWDYPIAVAIGTGVNAASPILWVFMICASFAQPKGLFIAHFNWTGIKVNKVMRYYQLAIWVIMPLVIAVISFDQFNDHEFASSLGRCCFILLCFALISVTYSLHKAKIPLQLDRKSNNDSILNSILWGILLSAPWLAIFAACAGYLRTSQLLLGRLEASAVIWFSLLVVYYIIRRWMLIQRRRIEFERAKQRRAERLAQRAKSEEEANIPAAPLTNTDSIQDIDEPIVDLDAISAQSLQLVRSILSMIALVSVILLWSELHSAFAFLENITLWSSRTISQGVEIIQKITLGSVLIAALVLMITAQLVRNLPALLELAILQHLDLTPGTGYAISTVTKYIILLLGGVIAFSFIGIDWSTLQWLIAALGVGLGFGLQEIFANFISGLIILFEKPIRIGDTVTIRDLTGTITKINTRATTIIDWDRKEIIVPNKSFITEQFINWSLSDSITRIVLTIPATVDANSQLVIDILKKAAAGCSYVLDDPQCDAFLVDIQEGIQLFELRVFTGDMGHRMPVRNEIHQLVLAGYREHGLVLPFPPFQASIQGLGRKSDRRIFKSGGL